MSILNVNKLGPVGGSSTITVAAGVASYTGKINCPEFDNNPSFTGNVTIAGNLGVAGTITYEDVARVDATGISTFREGYQVGPLTGIALTAYKDGSIRSTGIITASSFVGDVTGEVNASKFDTNPSGVVVTGVATATAFIPSQGQLSNRNLIINGAMTVAQRATSSTANGYGTVDRFRNSISGNDEAPTQAQHALTSSDTGPWEKGFRYSYHITNGNQTSGAGAADYINPKQLIEAQNIANSGWNYTSTSSYITISFWVKSSVAQNFYGNIRTNDGTDYNYVWETGALSANTWTKITKTIPGNSNLQFDNNNGNGLEVYPVRCFDGTDRTASMSLNAWGAHSNSSRTPDQTSTWYTTNDATLEFTGVQLEVGSVSTPFEHKSYAEELRLCQRYFTYIPSGTVFAGRGASSSLYLYSYSTPVPLRASPTVGKNDDIAHGTFSIRRYRDSAGVSDSTNTPTTNSTYFQPETCMIHLSQDGFTAVDDRSATLFISGGAITLSAEI